MLVDLHLTPRDLSPADLAQAARQSGLHGVVVTDTHRTDRLSSYMDALRAAGVAAYAGVELALERGFLVFIPRVVDPAFLGGRWSPNSAKWPSRDAAAACEGRAGFVFAGHPYCRDLESVLFDGVLTLPGLNGVETRVARGRPLWDSMADDVAGRRSLTRLGTCGGDPAFLGRALTYVHGETLSQAALVDALMKGNAWPIELEARGQSRAREEEYVPPPPRDDDGEGGGDDRPRGRDRGDRGDRPRGRGDGGGRERRPRG